MEGYQEVNEINLIDLMLYCLKRWRWIVVCMIFLAIVAGVYKYQATITDNQFKREQQVRQSVMESVEDKTEEEAEAENEPIVFEDPVTSAVTFAVVGMVGGVCIMCLIFCLSYVMGGKLQDISNFQRKFGVPLLGVIRKRDARKKIFGFVDRWICRLEEGPCAKIPRNEQIKIAAVNVQNAICKNPDKLVKRVMLAGTVASSDVIEICEELVEEIENVTFSPYRQVVFHAAALKKMEYYEGILFIERQGESYEKLIRQEMDLALDREVRVLGAIVC